MLAERGLFAPEQLAQLQHSLEEGETLPGLMVQRGLLAAEHAETIIQQGRERPPGAGSPAEHAETIVERSQERTPAAAPGGPESRLPRVGEVLGGCYRVDDVLGRGNMGVVLRAFDQSRGQPVAVKLIRPELAEAVDLVRFRREAELAARVDKQGGIVRVHAFGTHRGLPFCVMELVEGESLEDALRRGVAPQRLARIVAELAETLELCHRAGVVHRDLKPANVLLRGDDDTPKLCDFGLARDLGATERLTRTGDIMGSPAYMAPEQADDTLGPTDARTDVHALGAILYEGLAGRPPFPGSSILAVLQRVVDEDPPPPSSLNPAAPAALEAVIRRAMAKRPAERYPGAGALAEDLRRFLRGAAVRAERGGQDGARASRTLALTVSLTLVLLLVGFGGLAARAWLRAREGEQLLVSLRTFEATRGLKAWRLGLEDGGQPPTPADLQAALAQLARARELGMPPGELLGLERSLAAQERLAAHLRGERVRVPGALDPERGPLALAVDALVLSERERHDQALERAELALDQAPGELRELLRAAGRRCLSASFQAEVAQATRRNLADIRAGQADVLRVAERFQLDPASLATGKRAGLERSTPAWAAEVNSLARRPNRATALQLVGRLAAALHAPVAVEPGPRLRADVLEPLVQAFVQEDPTPAQVIDAVHVENAVFYGLDSSRRAPARLVTQVDRLAVLKARIERDDLEVFLFCLRHDIKTVQLDGIRGFLRSFPAARIETLTRQRPGSRALACCFMELGIAAEKEAGTANYHALEEWARAVLAAPLPDLGPGYSYLTYRRLAEALWGQSHNAPPEQAAELARESIAVLWEGLACAEKWSAGEHRMFLEEIAHRTLRAEGLETARAVWEQVCERCAQRVEAARTGPGDERLIEIVAWQRLMLSRAWFLFWNGCPDEALSVADAVLNSRLSLGGERARSEARAVRAEVALLRGDFEQAERELGSDAATGIRLYDGFAWAAFRAAQGRGDLALALARARQGVKHHPIHKPLREWLLRLDPAAELPPLRAASQQTSGQ